MFNQFGDLERCALRPGNVHGAHGWRDLLEPVVGRCRDKTLTRDLFADIPRRIDRLRPKPAPA